MPEDHRDDDMKETYHKVDQREWLREEEPPEAETASAEAGETPGEAVTIDTYAVLRMCIGMFVEQAWVELGLRVAPGASDTRQDLPQAKLAIDTVAYMRGALEGNLTAEEKREMDQVLASLRMNFVQRM